MKILILEPSYSNFNINLAKYLSNDIEALVFNIGNYIYLKGAKKTIVHKKILQCDYSDSDLLVVKNTKTLYSETLRKLNNKELPIKYLQYMARYMSYIRNFLQTHKVKLVIMHNDLRWQHALAIKVCRELKIKYLVMENGFFRPDTITVDSKGVNFYGSLPKNKSFYKKLTANHKKLKSYKSTTFTNLKTNIKFTFFILINKIGDILGLNSIVKNKNYSLLKYVIILLKMISTKKKQKITNLPKKYIFVPLQVNTDTQILVHSDFKNTQEFISTVEKEFYKLKTNLHLVFKIHPMENGVVNYKFDDRSIVTTNSTKYLIEHSQFVITINSTVGLEAIQKYKKVIVLGRAFFKISGIAITCSKADLAKILTDTVVNQNNIDKQAIDGFIQYLRCNYQINGNFNNYDNSVFAEIKNKLDKTIL